MTADRNLYEFLQNVRERPAMFVRNWSLIELEAMCHGYDVALNTHRIDEFGARFNRRFGDWLYQRFDWSTNQGWARTILDQSPDPENAFRRFFELLEQFKGELPGVKGAPRARSGE